MKSGMLGMRTIIHERLGRRVARPKFDQRLGLGVIFTEMSTKPALTIMNL